MECPYCEGTGGWWIGHGGNEREKDCEHCHGTGEIEDEEIENEDAE